MTTHNPAIFLHVNTLEIDAMRAIDPTAILDGDCGNAWGERRENGCAPHVMIADPSAETLAALHADGVPFALTLAGEWSALVALSHGWAEHACRHALARPWTLAH